MIRMPIAFLAAVVVTLSSAVTLSSVAFGQEAPVSEDMRFVRELRARGYSDLARDYLQKLTQNAPPELKRELPLEIAKTNMEAANDEPDSGKRLSLYAQARADFQKFISDNPKHPRVAEARFDIARGTTLQGKTQLSRALLQDDINSRVAEGLKARAIFGEAFGLLKSLPPTPQTELAMGLNLFDQAQTYLNEGSDKESRARSEKVREAQKIIDKIAQGNPNEKLTWQAQAWAGRCMCELGEPNKGRRKYTEIIDATGPAAAEGKRLARYFRLLAIDETPKPDENPQKIIIEAARRWVRDFPSYGRMPEGYGIRFLLAKHLLREAENPMLKLTKPERDNLVKEARVHLRHIEQTENDYTDRAKRLKIVVMNKQGAFKDPVAKLKSFEDCYIRAQFEIMEIGQDAKKYKDDKEKQESARKARVATAIDALENALKKPEAKGSTIEVYNARAMLAFYYMSEGKYPEAIQLGEGFARKDPRSSQAAMAAAYALTSYGQMIAKRERDAADPKALQNDPKHKEDKARMLDLAKYMESRWPKELAGDLARHQIGERLLREEKYPEAIATLGSITKTYPSYARTQLDLACAALQQAEQDKDKNDPNGYRKRAVVALTGIPDPGPTAQPAANRDFIQAKVTLGWELFKDKEYTKVDALAGSLRPKLSSLRLLDDPSKDKEVRGKFEDNVVLLSLYSTAAQAEAHFKAARYAEVTKLLDPIVDQFNADKLPQLKDNISLAMPVLGLALKSHIQTGNLQRPKVVIKALQSLQGDKGDSGASAILSQLVVLITHQIEDLRRKGDKDNLKKARDGFTSILNELGQGQKTPTPKLAYLLAKCYAGMEEHKKAADLLKPFAARNVAEAAGPDVQIHHAIQMLLIDEWRQLKEIDKAKDLLNQIITTKDGKPNWGAKNIGVQKLRVVLFEDAGDYNKAAQLAAILVKQLLPKIGDNTMKEHYLELYYHLIYCILKNGQGLDSTAQKTKAIKDAAQRIVNLEKTQSGFGSDESRKRFEELLEKEADLREQYKALKNRGS